MNAGRRRVLIGTVSVGVLATGAMGMSGAEAADGAYVQAARQGALGTGLVGVIGVYAEPVRAQIVVVGNATGTQYEATHFITQGQEVWVGHERFVASIRPGGEAFPGGVAFQPAGGGVRPWPADSVILDGPDGGLRLNGPELQTATEIRVTALRPDAQHPNEAEVEWWPAMVARDYAAPGDIHTGPLARGAHAMFGRTSAEVLAIEGTTELHPARVVLRILPSR